MDVEFVLKLHYFTYLNHRYSDMYLLVRKEIKSPSFGDFIFYFMSLLKLTMQKKYFAWKLRCSSIKLEMK